MLVKRADNDLTNATAMTDFHSSNDTSASREIRGLILAKGIVSIAPDKLQTSLKVRVSRAAWRRASPMRENDRIALVFAANTEGTNTVTVDGFGTIWVRANG